MRYCETECDGSDNSNDIVMVLSSNISGGGDGGGGGGGGDDCGGDCGGGDCGDCDDDGDGGGGGEDGDGGGGDDDDDDDDDELFRFGFSKAKYGSKISNIEFWPGIVNGKCWKNERAYGNRLSVYGSTIVSNETLRPKR